MTVCCRALLALVVLAAAARCGAEDLSPSKPLSGRDTLASNTDPSEDAQQCLDGLCWPAAEFEVRTAPAGDGPGDLIVRFPSPIQSSERGDVAPDANPSSLPHAAAHNDTVVLEGYLARDAAGQPLKAPAVVVVHESGSGMTVGRMIARSLPQHRVHAFLIHLPWYGERRGEQKRPDAANIVSVVRQAVADVRRARDAVAALPHVDSRHIALQGTSLGGFVAALAGSLDHGYDSVHLLLAGGDLYDVIQKGQKDAAKFRTELARAGFEGEALKQLVHVIEPTRIAHRLRPRSTWLYSASYDTVVPPRNAQLLATAARLDKSHHVELAANHYSGIVYLPFVLQRIVQSMHGLESDASSSPGSQAVGGTSRSETD